MDSGGKGKRFISTEVLLGTAVFTGLIFGIKAGYSRYIKQYKTVTDIPINVFKHRWLYGKVTAVGDGDNFRFFHTPGGILGGWGTFRTIPTLDKVDIKTNPNQNKETSDKKLNKKNISFVHNILPTKNQKIKKVSQYYLNLEVLLKGKRNLPTIPIRLSGIDAPERAHFGSESQPFSDEALNWLRYSILGKRVWIKPLSIDQYNRCVARAVYWSWLGGWKDISLQMLKEGLAVVYEGKTGAQFDHREKVYRFNEFIAKSKKKGLWIQKNIETPGEFKKRQ